MSSESPNTFSLSVVIAFKNQYQDVACSLESVLKQSIVPDQILLIDCGSTDGGITKLQKRYDDRVQVIRHCNNSLPAGRNDALRFVESNYVVFLQAGDRWEPHFVSELAQLHKQYESPMLMATQYQMVDKDESYQDAKIKVTSQASRTLFKNYLSAANAGDAPLVLSSFCIALELFSNRMPFEFNDEYNSLRLFLIKMALAAPIAYSQKVMVFKQLVSRPASFDDINDPQSGVPKFVRKAQSLLNEGTTDSGVKKALRKYLSVYLLKLAEHEVDHGRFEQAREIFAHTTVIKGLGFGKVWFKYFLRNLGSARHKDLLY